jgi:hypothetical protein
MGDACKRSLHRDKFSVEPIRRFAHLPTVPGAPARLRSFSLVANGAGFPNYKNKSGDMREPRQPLFR